MRCCFIGYKDSFGSKKEYKKIENVIETLIQRGVKEFYSRSGGYFEYMCEDEVRKTNCKLIYVHHNMDKAGSIIESYYDFVCYFNVHGNVETQMFYRNRYVIDVCDVCIYLPCDNIEENNLLGYARKKNKKII